MKTRETPMPLIASEIDLIYKSTIKASQRPQIKTSHDAYKLFLAYWDADKIELIEQFKVLFLNRSRKVLGIYDAFTGGTYSTIVDIKLLFAAALKANAHSLIVAHNHPSGGTKPSGEDIRITSKIREAGNLLDIPLCDHVIVCPDEYYSFADDGIL